MDTNTSTAPIVNTPSNEFIKPMALLISAWEFFKANWKVLVSIVAVPSIITLAGQLVSLGKGAWLLVSFLVSVVGFVFYVTVTPTLIDTISKIDSGLASSVKLWSQYKIGFGYFFAVLGLGILMGFIGIGSGIFLLVPYVIVVVFTTVYLYARILDGKKGFSAFTESYSLVKGRWWKVLGRIMAFALVYLVVSAIIAIVNLSVVAVLGKNTIATAIVSIILNILPIMVMVPMGSIYMYRMFTSLKATRLSDVRTVVFKRWLVAFLCVGVLLVVAMLVLMPTIFISLLRQ